MTDHIEQRIEDTEDAWDPNGPLGHEEKFTAAVGDNVLAQVDTSLGLVPISIRLQKDLLDNLKALAQLNGLGYQPLIRQVLTRFVDCELKSILKEQALRKAEAKPEDWAIVGGATSHEAPQAPNKAAA